MSAAAIEDAEKALAELHGPARGGHDNLRRLNLSSFIGERYGQALVEDWKAMRALLRAARGEAMTRELHDRLTAFLGNDDG